MLTPDQSGNCCWFVEYYGNKIAHLDPLTNSLEEWGLPTSSSNPYGIAITTINGTVTVWGTEFSSDKIYAFSPALNRFSEYALPVGSGPGYISVEPESGATRVWFTETTRNGNGEFVYDPTSGNVTFYDAPFPSSVGGGAYGLYAGPGYVWFAGFSSLVRWDRASGEYTMWPLPNHGSAVGRSIAFDSSGQLWYTQGTPQSASNDNFVGALHGNIIQEWRMPGFGSNPRAISVDPLTQQPWIAERFSLQRNGTAANLDDFGNATLFLSSPTTALATSTVAILSPTISHVFSSNYSITEVSSTSNSIDAYKEGPFLQYSLGATLPSDALVDSTGDVWMSEPAANKIVRLSTFSPTYALGPTTTYLPSTQGTTATIVVTASSLSGYTGQITFTASGLPPGVTLSAFDPNPLYVPAMDNVSATLAVNITRIASAGTDFVTIRGTDGNTTHTIGLILMITNATVQGTRQRLETRCFVTVPIYLAQSTLLLGLLIDVLIGAAFFGIPLDYFSRKLWLARALNRQSWLIVCLLAPTLLAVASAILLAC